VGILEVVKAQKIPKLFHFLEKNEYFAGEFLQISRL